MQPVTRSRAVSFWALASSNKWHVWFSLCTRRDLSREADNERQRLGEFQPEYNLAAYLRERNARNWLLHNRIACYYNV